MRALILALALLVPGVVWGQVAGPNVRLYYPGTNNTGMGQVFQHLTAAASDNTACGYNALSSLVSDTRNTACGSGAGMLATGHAGTYFGAGAGGSVTTPSDNWAFGVDALNNDDGTSFVTGTNNGGAGVHTLGHLGSGSFNLALGNESMVGCGTWAGVTSPTCVLTGNKNVGVGNGTLAFIQGVASENFAGGDSACTNLTTGNQNVCLGSLAGSNLTTGSINIVIGRDIRLASATGSNQLNIGNLITGTGVRQGGDFTPGTVSINGNLDAPSISVTASAPTLTLNNTAFGGIGGITLQHDGGGNAILTNTRTCCGGVSIRTNNGGTTAISASFAGEVLTRAFVRTVDPTTSDIAAGLCADWNNTTAGTYKHVCNFAGTLRSVAMN